MNGKLKLLVKNNIKILILEGGFNEEHEVSLKTSYEVQKVLKKNKILFQTLLVNPKYFEKQIKKFKNYVCFNALHGPFGEDGKIQKILKKNYIKYTHSAVKSSEVCFDKLKTKKIINKNNILTPEYTYLHKNRLNLSLLKKIKKKYTKFVIKPNKSGSSFGIKIIKDNNEFNNFIKNLKNFKKQLKHHDKILIEKLITGKELTVSTTKFSKKIEALAVTEIKPKSIFFDYKSKYSKGFAKHILPANLSQSNYKKCLKISKKAHKLLNCGSIARTDFIIDPINEKLYFLETNTQPGLTPISLLPEQAKYRNISFENIVLSIIKNIN